MSGNRIKVATVQWLQKSYSSRQGFWTQVESLTASAADYGAKLIVFPEYLSFSLLASIKPNASLKNGMQILAKEWADIQKRLSSLAKKYRLILVGGSHLYYKDEQWFNAAVIASPDGELFIQDKLHITPNEKSVYKLSPGNNLQIISTPFGKMGVLICYDSEFPELPRVLANQGVQILCVPYLTDDEQGYWRVRASCHARAIENQIFVVMSGSTGFLTGVANADRHFSKNAIFSPSDLGFPRGGILAEAQSSVEELTLVDLDLRQLEVVRRGGSVRNFKDQRTDFYRELEKSFLVKKTKKFRSKK